METLRRAWSSAVDRQPPRRRRRPRATHDDDEDSRDEEGETTPTCRASLSRLLLRAAAAPLRAALAVGVATWSLAWLLTCE